MGASRRAQCGQKRGILFGPERTGLDNDEVALADAIITFPVNPAYASLNLAQAVLLSATNGSRRPTATRRRRRDARAARRRRSARWCSPSSIFSRRSSTRGFFRPVGKKPGMRRNLRNIFHRIELTQQDVRTLWGAVVRLVEGPRVEVKTRKRMRPKKTDACTLRKRAPR